MQVTIGHRRNSWSGRQQVENKDCINSRISGLDLLYMPSITEITFVASKMQHKTEFIYIAAIHKYNKLKDHMETNGCFVVRYSQYKAVH